MIRANRFARIALRIARATKVAGGGQTLIHIKSGESWQIVLEILGRID